MIEVAVMLLEVEVLMEVEVMVEVVIVVEVIKVGVMMVEVMVLDGHSCSWLQLKIFEIKTK